MSIWANFSKKKNELKQEKMGTTKSGTELTHDTNMKKSNMMYMNVSDSHRFNMNSPYTRSESSSYETFTIAHIAEKD